MKENTKKIILEIVIFLSILIIALAVRGYNLSELPRGIHVDEAGMAYDAFSLANFRVDRYLKHLPVYLINFGGGQSALYAYLAAICVKFLGITTTAIRLPALFCNIIAIVAVYLLGRKAFGRKGATILMFLWAINPWNIMSSRWGLDCNLLAPLSIISLWLLFRAEKWYDYVVAGIAIGVTLYTYAISYLIMPLFLILIVSYMLYTKRITFKNVVILGIPIFILAIPLMLMLLVNNGFIKEINSFITIPKLLFYRGTEISFANIVNNILNIKTLFTYDGLSYNSIEKFGTVYYFSIPFIVLGLTIEIMKLVKNIKNKKFEVNTGITLFFFSVCITILLIVDPNINKANAIYFPLMFLVFSSIKFLYEKMDKKIFLIYFAVMMMAYCLLFISFINHYFNIYSVEWKYQPYFEDDLTNSIAIVNSKQELKDKKVNILTMSLNPYVYTLIVNQPSPYDFAKTRNEKDEWGKYLFNRQEINEDWVYIIKDYGDFAYDLANNYGFNTEYVGTYVILYK